MEVCIFPADVNLQRLRDRAFSIHGGQAGYMVVRWELLSAAGFRRTAWWRPPQGISRNVVFFSCMHLNVFNMWSGFAHSLSRSFLSTIARSRFRPFDYLCLPFFFLSCHLSCNPFFSYSIFLQLFLVHLFLSYLNLFDAGFLMSSYSIVFRCRISIIFRPSDNPLLHGTAQEEILYRSVKNSFQTTSHIHRRDGLACNPLLAHFFACNAWTETRGSLKCLLQSLAWVRHGCWFWISFAFYLC